MNTHWIARLLWRGRARTPIARLVDCERCGRDFVNPVAWRAHDAEQWWMLLRCGGCGLSRELLVSNAEACRFDAELDHGVNEIARSLARLRREDGRLDRDRGRGRRVR